jgi:hypothetical protein
MYLNEGGGGQPSTKTWPESPRGSLRSARISRRDDLPQPVGPKYHTMSVPILRSFSSYP